MARDTPPDPDCQRASAFPDAKLVHEAIRADPDEYPAGWVEQVRFRECYDLPPFRPPRFVDGVGVRETVSEIEAEHGVNVSFVRYDASNEGWTVEVDGERRFHVPRHRDDASNTVVETTAAAFRDHVEEHLHRGEY